jgi:hypothetical protein
MPTFQTTVSMNLPYGTQRWQFEKAISDALVTAQKELGGYGRPTYTETVMPEPSGDEALATLLTGLFVGGAAAASKVKNRKRK